jgi:FG-GAP repeat
MPRLRLLSTVILFSTIFLSAAVLRAATPPVSVVQLAELTPSTRATNDWFGISIAVSGNTVVVGDFDANIENYGAVYVYVKPASGWANMTQVAKLTSSDNGEGFGVSVAISGNTIAVGAANTSNFSRSRLNRPNSAPAAGPGAAYVFVKPASGWKDMTETAKLTASDGQPGDAFGDSVSISGPTIAVGAFFAPDSSGNSFAGKAYVFVLPSSGWSGSLNETARLTASDSQLLNYMGASIAISGTTVVAGSYGHNNFQGTAYVFAEPSSGWSSMTQTAELTASDGKGSDDFGFSSSISGSTVVIGAVNAAVGKGAAYVFVKPSAGWANMTQTAELRAPNATQGDGFGQSAAISGNLVVVGASGANVGANQLQGAAYVFARPSSGWKNTNSATELTAADGAANDNLGVSASISGSTIVAGAPKSTTPGSAYVFGP